jgi:hypothetical protein
VYLAHQQGVTGAKNLLGNPNARAGDVTAPGNLSANQGDPNAPASQFTEYWRRKYEAAAGGARLSPAMAGGSVPQVPNAAVQYGSGLGLVRSANAGAVTNNNTTTNNEGHDVDINITTQPGANAQEIGGALQRAMRNSVLATQANTGAE